jgi:hypothetical protein
MNYTKHAKEMTASGVVMNGPGYYYGFVGLTNGVDRPFKAWDNPTTAAGLKVDNYEMLGTNRAGGHELNTPVYCVSGLYVGVSGYDAVVYYYKFPI